jgi:hypothetical protein
MRLSAFCEQGHEREKMYREPDQSRYYCQACKFQATDEFVYQSVPKQYRALFDGEFGLLAASMMNLAGIDVVFTNAFMPNIEYPRES